MKMKRSSAPVETGHVGLPTRVLVGAGASADGKLLRRLVGKRAAVVVAPPSIEATHLRLLRGTLDAACIRHAALVCDDGERGKSLEAAAELYRAFEAVGADRDTLVIAQGGGTLSDLVGFAAATFLRGLPFAVIPTTLLSQGDACVGGKCGVHFEGMKNRIGAFHHPEWALIDPETLLTLPEEHFRAGFAELAKGALLHSREAVDRFLAALPALAAREPEALAAQVSLAIEVKCALAGEDPDERGTKRVALNLGHTLGHALESVSGFALTHGEAVAAGLLFALHVTNRAAKADHPLLAPLARAFGSLGLLSALPFLEEERALAAVMLRDKKSRGDRATLVTLPAPGRPALVTLDGKALSAELSAFRERFVIARANG